MIKTTVTTILSVKLHFLNFPTSKAGNNIPFAAELSVNLIANRISFTAKHRAIITKD